MNIARDAQPGRIFIGSVNHDADLLSALTVLCAEKNIRAGEFSLIGAVCNAVVACYDQTAKSYAPPLRFDGPLEILSCIGNISLKEGKPFVHAHVVFSDASGRAFGGHLCEGTMVFAAEYTIHELTGLTLERLPDAETGLSLWNI